MKQARLSCDSNDSFTPCNDVDKLSVYIDTDVAGSDGDAVANLSNVSVSLDSSSHICDVCLQAFSSTLSLKTHVKKHKIKFHYKCNKCNGVFKQHSVYREILAIS